MSDAPLSDWTPIAYLQREKERSRNEQKPGGAVPPEQDRRNNDEKHLSGVTVASMQRRFFLLEQRLAILERQEHERQIREKFEAAAVHSQSGTSHSKAASFESAVTAIGRQVDDHSPAKSQPEFFYTKTEKSEPIDDRKTRDLHVPADSRHDESGLPNDFVEIGPTRCDNPIQAGLGYRIAAAFSSFVVTAFLASSTGFMFAILTVPTEKAAQIHALVNIAVRALSEAPHTK
jgi:hypothetical protein